MYKCTNCKWEGNELAIEPVKDKCPICGDNVSEEGKVIRSEPVMPEEMITKRYLNSQNKDWLNDHAAKIGLDEINTDMRKADMIKEILEFKENKDR